MMLSKEDLSDQQAIRRSRPLEQPAFGPFGFKKYILVHLLLNNDAQSHQ